MIQIWLIFCNATATLLELTRSSVWTAVHGWGNLAWDQTPLAIWSARWHAFSRQLWSMSNLRQAWRVLFRSWRLWLRPVPSCLRWLRHWCKTWLVSHFLSQCNWECIVTFLVNLKWKLSDTALTAYIELAYAFWHAGFKLEGLPETPEAYSKCIRKCANQALRNFPDMPIVPGVQISKCKSLGRTLPAGCISGAIPYLDKHALKLLAFRVLHGRSQFLRDWGVPF